MTEKTDNKPDYSVVFKYVRPTEYNTYFGRYVVTTIHIEGNKGTIGFLDIDKYPMVYHHAEVEVSTEGDGSGKCSIMSYEHNNKGAPVSIGVNKEVTDKNNTIGMLTRGFIDLVYASQFEFPSGEFVLVPRLDEEGNPVGEDGISPFCMLLSTFVAGWAEKNKTFNLEKGDLYLPVFAVDKENKYFTYFRYPGAQPADFSDINEFMNSEYYLTGDDVAPFVRVQQKACLLEIERQLMSTIN